MGFNISNIHEKIGSNTKKSIRSIYNAPYNSHTTSLFKDSKILKLKDVHELELGKFVYDALHNTLPKRLSEIYTPNARVHHHYTRQQNNPHVQSRHCIVAAIVQQRGEVTYFCRL